MDQENLIALIKKAKEGDEISNTLLINEYYSFVNSIVKKQCKDPSQFDDCVQEGLMGLNEAIQKFDVEKASSFEGYAYQFVKNYVLRHLYGDIDSPQSKKYLKIKEYKDKYLEDYGYDPNYEELSQYIEDEDGTFISPDEISEIFEEVTNRSNTVYIEDQYTPVKDIDIYDTEDTSTKVNNQKEHKSTPHNKVKKSAKCMKMLLLLQDGNYHSLNDIAASIGDKKRNVLNYKNDLIAAGYEIKEKRGPNGGYRLLKNNLFPVMRLSNDEFNALRNAHNFVMQNSGFPDKNTADMAFKKVLSSIKTDTYEKEELLDVEYSTPNNMPQSEIDRRYNILKEALDKCYELEMVYSFVRIPKKKIVIHIYNLYAFNNVWYFDCLNITDQDDYVRLSLNRIETIHKTGRTFNRIEQKEKSPEEVERKIGNRSITVTYIAKNEAARYIRANDNSDNKILEDISEDKIKVITTFKSKYNMLRYILGNASNIEVLEPQEVIDEIKQYITYLQVTYNK